MQKGKKILSLLLALMLVFGIMAPAMAEEVGHQTVIRIHKIVMPKAEMDKHTDEGKVPKYNGTQIENINQYFTGGKEVAGIAFDVYREVDATEEGTIAHTDAILGGKGVDGKFYKKVNKDPLLSTETGIDTPELANGAYIIVENKQASTYTGEKGEAITDSKAIPTRIELPMTKPDGTGLFGTGENDKLHIYPKNSEGRPEIDKNFAKEKHGDVPGVDGAGADYAKYQAEKATISRMVGEAVPYEVKTKIPAGSEYKTVRWEDTMTMGLTFNKDLVLNPDTFIKDTDYIVTQNESGFVVEFTEAGLEKLAKEAKTKDVEITLHYTATINDSAVVDNPDENNIIFNYSNKPNEFKDPRDNEVKPKEKQITVTKTWADGKAPEGVSVTYYLYEKGDKAENDKVVASIVKKGGSFDHTFSALDESKNYYVKEIVVGYTPEYKVGEGSVDVTNTKDNNNPPPLDPTEPKVVTHGKKFVKADETTGTRLSGAEFVIKNATENSADKGKFLALLNKEGQEKALKDYTDAEKAYQDAIAAWNKAVAENAGKPEDQIEVQIGNENITGKTAVEAKIAQLKTTRDNAFEVLNRQWEWVAKQEDAFKFTSNQFGQFEVIGLAAGKYTVVETKAPAGYALPSNPDIATFEAKDGSYTERSGVKYEGKETVNNTNGDALRINNKKVTIPQTGGIGTLIFTAAGVALMGGAAIAMKKNKEEE